MHACDAYVTRRWLRTKAFSSNRMWVLIGRRRNGHLRRFLYRQNVYWSVESSILASASIYRKESMAGVLV